ncbi:MAG: hypothetical protein J6386_17720 [Candidatus Synoicihabitans palmerolidicus]|nr:hypothetical protein [Candidatus Synoicihabitans palmerolidicus]
MVISNTGIYNKSGTGSTELDLTFDLNGTLNLNAGSLNLAGGGTLSSSGSLISAHTISANTTSVNFDGSYSITDAASLSGSGSFALSTGTLSMDGQVNVSNVTLNGGVLTGASTFNQGLGWNNGELGTSTTTNASGSTLSVNFAVDHVLSNHALVNDGDVDWKAGDLLLNDASTITNQGTFDDTAAWTAETRKVSSSSGTAGSFTNTQDGTYNKGRDGTTVFEVPFNNAGSANVNSGTLKLGGGGTLSSTGTLTAATGTDVVIESDYTVDDAASLNGNGTYSSSSGTLTMSGTFSGGQLELTGGTLQGTHDIESQLKFTDGTWSTGSTSIKTEGTLLLAAPSNTFDARDLTNLGTVNWQNGDIVTNNDRALTNRATWNDTAASTSNETVSIRTDTGAAGSFTNASEGTYLKSSFRNTQEHSITSACEQSWAIHR